MVLILTVFPIDVRWSDSVGTLVLETLYSTQHFANSLSAELCSGAVFMEKVQEESSITITLSVVPDSCLCYLQQVILLII